MKTMPERRLVIAWTGLLTAILIINLLDMPSVMWAGDPTMWREETRSIVFRQRLSVDPVATLDFNEANQPGQYFVQNTRNGLWYSKYGIMNSVMAVPPMLAQRIFRNGQPIYRSKGDVLIYNLWNLVLTIALAAVLMSLSGLYTRRIATRLIFVFTTFYCTYLWIYLRAQTSELYQTLFYCAMFLFLMRFIRGLPAPLDAVRVVDLHVMWVLVGLLVLTRVLYVLLLPLCLAVLSIAIWKLASSWRTRALRMVWPHMIVPPVLILAALGTVNYVKFGSPLLSGYHQWMPNMHLPTGPLSDGLDGLLFRPRFSVFLYFPLLIFALIWIWPFFRRYPVDATAAIGGLALFVLALAKIPTWPGEWTYGPRYVLFALPAAGLACIPLIDKLIDLTRRNLPLGVTCTLPILAVLIYSAYLQFRVNELDFFTFYYVRPPDLNAYIHHFFEGRPVGMTLDELLRKSDRLESTRLYYELANYGSRNTVEGWARRTRQFLDFRNNYWWGDPEEQLPQ